MTNPISKVKNKDQYFLICTDVSKEGLGGVLMQEGMVITYASRKLQPNE